jgi:hypothetical protein
LKIHASVPFFTILQNIDRCPSTIWWCEIFHACSINTLTYYSNRTTFLFTNKIELKCFTHLQQPT